MKVGVSLNNKKGVTMLPKKLDLEVGGPYTNAKKINEILDYLQEREEEKCNHEKDSICHKCWKITPPQQTNEWVRCEACIEGRYWDCGKEDELTEFNRRLMLLLKDANPELLAHYSDNDDNMAERFRKYVRTHFIEKKKVREELERIGDWLEKEGRNPYMIPKGILLSSLQLTEDK